MTTGEQIKNIRQQKKLSQKKLGKLLGVSQQMIGQWESASANLTIETIQKIAAALEVSLFDLIDKEEFDNAIHIKVREKMKSQINDGTTLLLPAAFVSDYIKLNDTGKQEAEKRIHELTEIPRYTQKEKNQPDKEE